MTRFLSVLLMTAFSIVGAFAQAPPTPTELDVSRSEMRFGANLSWESAQGNHQYRIYRSPNDSAHFAAIGTSGLRRYFDSTIVRGTRYYYFVKSFIGTTESNRSNIANILIQIPPPLPTPTNLNATVVFGHDDGEGDATVRLNWVAPHGPWSFRIYRSSRDTLHYRLIESRRDTVFFDDEVRVDSTYYYYVRAAFDASVSPRSNVASVHIVLPPRTRGTIRGTIVDDSTNAPIRHVRMKFYRVGPRHGGDNGDDDEEVFTDSLGRYSALLDTGRYVMRANPSHEHNPVRYRSEYYNNCYEPSCATVIAVLDSQSFTANMGLARLTPPSYAYISGVVKDTANNPLRHARVSVFRTMQEMNFIASLGLTPGLGEEEMEIEGVGHARGVRWSGYTDSLGRYSARVIANNNYIALASKEGFLPEYYNNKWTVETADIIVLGTRDTSGINFSLAVRLVPNNSVSGVVRDSLGTLVPSRITLIPARHEGGDERYVHTDSLGAYSVTGVEAGKYFVLASPFSGFGHALYKAGAYGIIRIQDADTVNVSGNVTGINVGVRRIGSSGLTLVRGAVRNGAAPIAGVRVAALSATGKLLSEGVTDGFGAYALDAVPSGVVTVLVDRRGYNATQTSFIVNENVFTMNDVNLVMSPNGVTSVSDNSALPGSFALNQNYPNPFNPTTTISFQVPVASKVNLRVFNVLGQEVALLMNDEIAAGNHTIVWMGKDNAGHAVASGIYFYRLSASATTGGKEFSSIRKMLLVK